MASPVLGRGLRLALAGDLQTALGNGTLHLYTAVAGESGEFTLLADFTEAAYPAYAAASVTAWGNVTIDNRGEPNTVMPPAGFVGPSSGDGEAILGCYYATGSDSVYPAWWAPFDSAVSMNNPLSFLQVAAQVDWDGEGTITITGSSLD
jgi:hypothetical protein